MSEERKKLTVYLHPDQVADNVSLDIIDSVPRNDRGDLYRKALISGLALHHLDPRLPGLLALLLDKSFTADSLVGLLSQTTGWKPSRPIFVMCLQNWGLGHLILQPSLKSLKMMRSGDWKRPGSN